MINIFIPSYNRADNLLTVKFLKKIEYDLSKVHILLDNESQGIEEYRKVCESNRMKLHIVDMEEARKEYDFIHMQSLSRRAVGVARNQIVKICDELNIESWVVLDDDTQGFQNRVFSRYTGATKGPELIKTFEMILEFMERKHIGLFGLSQTGDLFAKVEKRLLRNKVMNTSFYVKKYLRAEMRGSQDEDTSGFAGVMNEGYFTGSLATGVILSQVASGKNKGGLTEIYNELKLLNKALVVPIQFPSAVRAEKQERNGGRLHHRINYRYLMPKLMKGEKSNIEWDTYPEDKEFTNKRFSSWHIIPKI